MYLRSARDGETETEQGKDEGCRLTGKKIKKKGRRREEAETCKSKKIKAERQKPKSSQPRCQSNAMFDAFPRLPHQVVKNKILCVTFYWTFTFFLCMCVDVFSCWMIHGPCQGWIWEFPTVKWGRHSRMYFLFIYLFSILLYFIFWMCVYINKSAQQSAKPDFKALTWRMINMLLNCDTWWCFNVRLSQIETSSIFCFCPKNNKIQLKTKCRFRYCEHRLKQFYSCKL